VTATNLGLGRSLRSRVEQRNGGTWVALVGNLNEASDLTPLASLPGPITIDLGELDRINSVGVRYWMDFVSAREKAGVALAFERCSPMMVGQITMITRFMGTHSRVTSLLVPYACTKCRAEQLTVLDVASNERAQPTLVCPKCGSRMDLDDLVETYDEALRRVRR